jgi:hypothetical protein
MSTIHHAGSLSQPLHRFLIWTDSLDAVGVLNSLYTTKSLHNAPLLGIAQIILWTRMDLQVWHIEDKKNICADMLSRLLLDEYQRKFPADCIHFFSSPRDLLATQWSMCF